MERADLHIHTTASDGLLSPSDLVSAAAARGLAAIAITDHDVTDGVEEAARAGQRAGLDVLAGVEINTDHGTTEIHVLGYCMDIANARFQKTIGWLREGRLNRARAMVDRLRALGCPLDWDSVVEIARPGAIGRPHLADALVRAGFAASRHDAFNRFLGNNGPAYVPRQRFDATEAIRAIRDAGGVPVVAHPAKIGNDSLIRPLAEAGLLGIEARHPDHSLRDADHYRRMADALGLLWTGGSDFHGNNEARPLAGVTVPLEQARKVRAAARIPR